MSAQPKLYSDAGCTLELAKDGSLNYILSIGPDTGMDGNLGQTVTQQLWLKNTGDEIYQNVSLNEIADVPGRVTYSADDVTYANTISFGNIIQAAVQTFYAKVIVEANAPAGRNTFSFQLTGESI